MLPLKHLSKCKAWGRFVNVSLIYWLTQSSSFQLFPFSSPFIVACGDFNFLSHTHSLHYSHCLEKPAITSFNWSSTLGQLTGFFVVVVFFGLGESMLGWLAVEDLGSPVWWEDRSADSQTDWHTWVPVALLTAFPPPAAFLPGRATDLLKPLHQPTKVCVIHQTIRQSETRDILKRLSSLRAWVKLCFLL